MESDRIINILVIEDNDADVFLAKKALSTMKIKFNLHVIMDGAEAVEKLNSCGFEGEMPIPDLMFLDLNIPKIDGIEVLNRMKQNSRLGTIPVIALSSSRSDKEVRRIYALRGNAYLVKPQSLDEYKAMIAATEAFWFGHALLPNNELSKE